MVLIEWTVLVQELQQQRLCVFRCLQHALQHQIQYLDNSQHYHASVIGTSTILQGQQSKKQMGGGYLLV